MDSPNTIEGKKIVHLTLIFFTDRCLRQRCCTYLYE